MGYLFSMFNCREYIEPLMFLVYSGILLLKTETSRKIWGSKSTALPRKTIRKTE